ncbi:helix-turn-helix transcriptional regulator [Streptomyces varsoviensis]|uniref:helix-turn-helix domain-containing protein n=1 Tax=Streptomyces varsoviensis TaxID=67373 RepID=UPI0033FCB0DF
MTRGGVRCMGRGRGRPAAIVDGTQSPRHYWGSELARLREEAGLTQQELAAKFPIDSSHLHRLEHATRKPPDLEFVEVLDEFVMGRGHLVKTYKMVLRLEAGAKYADYFAEALALEPTADRIDWYGGSIVPGLLQTEGYVRALTVAAHPFWTAEKVEKTVDDRIRRAAVLHRSTPLQMLAILDEAALRRPVGGRQVMVEQLDHIAELASDGLAVVQVLPYEVGAFPLLDGQMIIYRFVNDPPLVYTEGSVSGQLVEEKSEVDESILMYDLTRGQALPPSESLAFIVDAIKEHQGNV